jgi:hypothetical protein
MTAQIIQFPLRAARGVTTQNHEGAKIIAFPVERTRARIEERAFMEFTRALEALGARHDYHATDTDLIEIPAEIDTSDLVGWFTNHEDTPA